MARSARPSPHRHARDDGPHGRRASRSPSAATSTTPPRRRTGWRPPRHSGWSRPGSSRRCWSTPGRRWRWGSSPSTGSWTSSRSPPRWAPRRCPWPTLRSRSAPPATSSAASAPSVRSGRCRTVLDEQRPGARVGARLGWTSRDGPRAGPAGPAAGHRRRRPHPLPGDRRALPSGHDLDAHDLVGRLTGGPPTCTPRTQAASSRRPFSMVLRRGGPDERPPMVSVSGITPSGRLTLGNYLGALRRFAPATPARSPGSSSWRTCTP